MVESCEHYYQQHDGYPFTDSMANSWNNVGLTYSTLGQYEKALEYQQKALTIRQKVLPVNHPDIAVSLKFVREASDKLND